MVDSGNIAKTAIAGLQSQPAFFVLAGIVVAVLGLAYLASQHAEERRVHQFDQILERCNFQQYGGPHG